MKRNTDNIFVIAQKEFADCIWSPRFWLMLGIIMAILIADGFNSGTNNIRNIPQLAYSFMSASERISASGALVAIGLGFDAICREIKSGSLNVLLTHPVYRDLVITGKFIGMAVALGLVTVVSVMISSGFKLYFSGITVSAEVIYRIVIYMMVVFLFMLSYLALSIAISAFTKEPSHSLLYNLALLIILTVFLSFFATFTAQIITGHSLDFSYNYVSDPSERNDWIKIRNAIIYISPFTHFDELVEGTGGPIFDAPPKIGTEPTPKMYGLFDTGFTLGYWVSHYWVNLVALIVMPVILLLISYMAFMRKEITL